MISDDRMRGKVGLRFLGGYTCLMCVSATSRAGLHSLRIAHDDVMQNALPLLRSAIVFERDYTLTTGSRAFLCAASVLHSPDWLSQANTHPVFYPDTTSRLPSSLDSHERPSPVSRCHYRSGVPFTNIISRHAEIDEMMAVA